MKTPGIACPFPSFPEYVDRHWGVYSGASLTPVPFLALEAALEGITALENPSHSEKHSQKLSVEPNFDSSTIF